MSFFVGCSNFKNLCPLLILLVFSSIETNSIDSTWNLQTLAATIIVGRRGQFKNKIW